MFKIFVADDHAVLRKGVVGLLTDTADFVVVGESDNGRDTIRHVAKTDVDVLLLDIKLPDMSGLDVLQRVLLDKPGLSVAIFTMFADETLAIRYLKAGASGYLTKEMSPDQLIEAIRHIAAGGKYLAPTLAANAVVKMQESHHVLPHQFLTDREFSIFLKIAAGMPLAKIADDLHLSPSTVSSYRLRILKKMAMSTNAELVRYAIQQHLIS
ncbi:MAG: response regulator transcription factor [Magnetococcales bacterium]|nr:response regulator transcription factor [Magnetococcales bacterium]